MRINLTLDIVSRRKDGYHDLVSLICPIGLYDDLCLSPARRLEIASTHPDAPGDERNLAYRAARLFLDRVDRRAGFRIELTKRIPVGAGLGGGSGNAAAVLVGLNRLYGEPIDQDALAAMGRQLGADVPFFIYGRPAVAMGTASGCLPWPACRRDGWWWSIRVLASQHGRRIKGCAAMFWILIWH